MNDLLKNTLHKVSRFYDQKKVGDVGPLGFRRSSDLGRLLICLDWLIEKRLLHTNESLFLDMGCADGRVNVLLSYLFKKSIGIEIDEWTLDEYPQLLERLKRELIKDELLLPPDNIYLQQGDSLEENTYRIIREKTNLAFDDFDFFYTYMTMYEELAELIARRGKKGAVFLIYGLEKVIPRLEGFDILTPREPLENILVVYRKK